MSMLTSKVARMAIALCILTACGSPPAPPNSSPLHTSVRADNGPRIGSQSILAAGDLDTMRALVDATASGMVRQLGGAGDAQQCHPPYALGRNDCWPDQRSRPGEAYAALAIKPGFCEDATDPRVYLSGHSLVVQVGFSKRFNCHLQGVMALPTASLVSFSTDSLKPGLYSVSFRFVSGDETYNSDSTYLSIPSPRAVDQLTMENEATAALASVIGDHRVGLFSLARVDGAQVRALCGHAVAGPAYLVTLDPDLSAPRRQMAVMLAGSPPRACAARAI